MAPPEQRSRVFEDACVFHGGGADVTRVTLRRAIAANATDQRAKWFASGALQGERVAERVPDLVRLADQLSST